MTDTDLEQRLHGALVRASDGAPSADGLAARVSARRARSRRTTGVGIGAALATAAAVVAVAVVPGIVSSEETPTLVGESPAVPARPWQTVTMDADSGGDDVVELEMPSDWVPLDSRGCEFSVDAYGPDGVDPCTGPQPASVFGSATFDPVDLPGRLREADGEWSGYVLAGDVAVSVAYADRDVVRRVLASVRLPGESAPPVASWSRVAAEGPNGVGDRPEVTADVPAGADVKVSLSAGFPDCEPGRNAAVLQPRGGWLASLCRDRIVSVTAPTRALADVVAATVRGY